MTSIVELHASTKMQFLDWIGVSQELLHVHVGLAVYLGVALICGRLSSVWALLTIALLELINETFDTLSGYQSGWLEPLRDLAMTLWWPLVIFQIARRHGRRRSISTSDPNWPEG